MAYEKTPTNFAQGYSRFCAKFETMHILYYVKEAYGDLLTEPMCEYVHRICLAGLLGNNSSDINGTINLPKSHVD